MTSIYVGHLSFVTTEEDLRKAFEQYGYVDSINIIMDRAASGPGGFAFVEMFDEAEAANAIANLNGREIAGCRVRVNEARPKASRRRRREGRPREWD
jgi:RNA recognition motif-containing protein